MGIERIKEIMAVPAHKMDSVGHQWDLFPSDLAMTLPTVYKEFLSAYGTGVINEFLWILNPFSANKNLNIEKMRYYQFSYRHMQEVFPDDYERNVPGSFLTWASTDNGDGVFWVIDGGHSNEWQVGIHSSDQGEEELTGLNTTQFFESLVKNTLKSLILPRQFLESEKIFISV